MKRFFTNWLGPIIWIATLGCFFAVWPESAGAQQLGYYTAEPLFVSKTVPPNILFIVDLGDQTLPAAYGNYPVSFKAGTVTASKYAANVNLGGPGDDLVSSNDNGVSTNTASTASPSDTFLSTTKYYGTFDPLRCYTYGSNNFIYAAVKTLSGACGITEWDGNFLNWLTMRKKDVSYQAFIGGTSKPAQANTDGTANVLMGEDVTGENGTNNSCNDNSKPCWRYVKYVRDSALSGRVPTGLSVDTRGLIVGPGRFFGVGDGNIYINTDNDASPFDAAPGDQYKISVDLRTEPDVPPQGSSASTVNLEDRNCIEGDAFFAGHLACYQRDRSLGLFQKLRTDNMRVAVMFANANSLKGGKLVVKFDDNQLGSGFSSVITGIRNEHIQQGSPISEAVYEGLCLYRKSQGPCYANSGQSSTGYDGSVGVASDPFFFVSNNQMVPCCKSYILLISAGVGLGDGNAPDLQTPFTDADGLFAGTDLGVTTAAGGAGRLDDVAFYGQTHDIRDQVSGAPGYLGATQKVTFYAVNSMGGSVGAQLLASAAKYGGFEDRNNDGIPDTGTVTCNYPAGSELGSGASISSPEWDIDKNCIPDTYFSAASGEGLADAINRAISDILQRAASGTSVSVLATSSTGEGTIYQAFFFPEQYRDQNKIKWTGYTQGLFVDSLGNLREDTNGDGRLTYKEDYIVKTRFDSSTNEVKVDRYRDETPTDGAADTTSPFESVGLKDVKPIWEAGRSLALRDLSTSPRNILTWVDTDNDALVDSGEVIAFNSSNANTLAPYLRADTSGTFTAANIVSFILGNQVSGMRDRELKVKGDNGAEVVKVWRYGDPINSTPTIVGAPKERFDVIYGDASYTDFYIQYKNRRLVAYVGANDGMLHAFNTGYYHRGDDPTSSGVTEHGYFTTMPNGDGGVSLGHELWGFIPYQLLPHLRWLTQTDYTHVYYVDLKPKVTDVRIFTPDSDHPNGWGTVLIGGFRMGGSCNICSTTTGAPKMSVTANFGSGSETRDFFSAYFVLDITNPEHDPVLLWSYSNTSMGLTTSYPAVLRVSPSTESNKTSNTNARWYAVFGSGVTGYDGNSAQLGKVFAVDLKSGPKDPGTGLFLTTTFSTISSDGNSAVGDLITLDANLDYRVDALYFGVLGSSGPIVGKGKMYRLTTTGCSSAPCGTGTWGYGTPRAPTVLLGSFTCSPSPCTTGVNKVGPVTAGASVTADDTGKVWLFFGTGRFYGTNDKTNTDTQHLFGVKDPVVTGGCSQTSATSCERNNLLDVSSVVVCIVCASGTNQVTGVSGVTTYDGLVDKINNTSGGSPEMDGWYTTLPTSKERALTAPTVLGGTVFFTTFIPNADICSASGDGYIYALFYKTGGAYKESVIGTYTSGSNTNVLRSMSLGSGLPSQMAVQIGAQGSGSSGAASGSGCTGRVTGFIQASTGALNQFCGKPALSSWSRYISWLNQRL